MATTTPSPSGHVHAGGFAPGGIDAHALTISSTSPSRYATVSLLCALYRIECAYYNDDGPEPNAVPLTADALDGALTGSDAAKLCAATLATLRNTGSTKCRVHSPPAHAPHMACTRNIMRKLPTCSFRKLMLHVATTEASAKVPDNCKIEALTASCARFGVIGYLMMHLRVNIFVCQKVSAGTTAESQQRTWTLMATMAAANSKKTQKKPTASGKRGALNQASEYVFVKLPCASYDPQRETVVLFLSASGDTVEGCLHLDEQDASDASFVIRLNEKFVPHRGAGEDDSDEDDSDEDDSDEDDRDENVLVRLHYLHAHTNALAVGDLFTLDVFDDEQESEHQMVTDDLQLRKLQNNSSVRRHADEAALLLKLHRTDPRLPKRMFVVAPRLLPVDDTGEDGDQDEDGSRNNGATATCTSFRFAVYDADTKLSQRVAELCRAPATDEQERKAAKAIKEYIAQCREHYEARCREVAEARHKQSHRADDDRTAFTPLLQKLRRQAAETSVGSSASLSSDDRKQWHDAVHQLLRNDDNNDDDDDGAESHMRPLYPVPSDPLFKTKLIHMPDMYDIISQTQSRSSDADRTFWPNMYVEIHGDDRDDRTGGGGSSPGRTIGVLQSDLGKGRWAVRILSTLHRGVTSVCHETDMSPASSYTMQQQLLRNYMAPLTPYRSVLVYHNVGSGKTLTALRIAEQYKDVVRSRGRKIQIICPKNVEGEFRRFLLMEGSRTSKLSGRNARLLRQYEHRRQGEHTVDLSRPQNEDIHQLYQRSALDDMHASLSKPLNATTTNSGQQLHQSLSEQQHDTYEVASIEMVRSQCLKRMQDGDSMDAYEQYIVNKFGNTVIVVDEVDTIIGDEDKYALLVFQSIFFALNRTGNTSKLIVMSATPYRRCEQFSELLNLMILNDGNRGTPLFDRTSFKDQLKKLNNDKVSAPPLALRRAVEGRVSFYRTTDGRPRVLFPDDVYTNVPAQVCDKLWFEQRASCPELTVIRHRERTLNTSEFADRNQLAQLFDDRSNLRNRVMFIRNPASGRLCVRRHVFDARGQCLKLPLNKEVVIREVHLVDDVVNPAALPEMLRKTHCMVAPISATAPVALTVYVYATNQEAANKLFHHHNHAAWQQAFPGVPHVRMHHHMMPNSGAQREDTCFVVSERSVATGVGASGSTLETEWADQQTKQLRAVSFSCAKQCLMLSANLESHRNGNVYDHREDGCYDADLLKCPMIGTKVTIPNVEHMSVQEARTMLHHKARCIVELAHRSEGIVFVYCESIHNQRDALKNTIADLGQAFADFRVYRQSNASSNNNFDAHHRPGFDEILYPGQLTAGHALMSGDIANVVPRHRVVVVTHELKSEERQTRIKDLLRHNRNSRGELIKVVIATAKWSAGVDLRNVRQVHVVRPRTQTTTGWKHYEQVMGRGIRRNSHIHLPPADRNVMCFLHTYIPAFKASTKRGIEVLTASNTAAHQHALHMWYERVMQLSLKECRSVQQYVAEERTSRRIETLLQQASINCVTTNTRTHCDRDEEGEAQVQMLDANHVRIPPPPCQTRPSVLCDPEWELTPILPDARGASPPPSFNAAAVHVARYVDVIKSLFQEEDTPQTLSYSRLHHMVHQRVHGQHRRRDDATPHHDANVARALHTILRHRSVLRDVHGRPGHLVRMDRVTGGTSEASYRFVPLHVRTPPFTADASPPLSESDVFGMGHHTALYVPPDGWKDATNGPGGTIFKLIFRVVATRFEALRNLFHWSLKQMPSVADDEGKADAAMELLHAPLMEYVVDSLPYAEQRALLEYIVCEGWSAAIPPSGTSAAPSFWTWHDGADRIQLHWRQGTLAMCRRDTFGTVTHDTTIDMRRAPEVRRVSSEGEDGRRVMMYAVRVCEEESAGEAAAERCWVTIATTDVLDAAERLVARIQRIFAEVKYHPLSNLCEKWLPTSGRTLFSLLDALALYMGTSTQQASARDARFFMVFDYVTQEGASASSAVEAAKLFTLINAQTGHVVPRLTDTGTLSPLYRQRQPLHLSLPETTAPSIVPHLEHVCIASDTTGTGATRKGKDREKGRPEVQLMMYNSILPRPFNGAGSSRTSGLPTFRHQLQFVTYDRQHKHTHTKRVADHVESVHMVMSRAIDHVVGSPSNPVAAATPTLPPRLHLLRRMHAFWKTDAKRLQKRWSTIHTERQNQFMQDERGYTERWLRVRGQDDSFPFTDAEADHTHFTTLIHLIVSAKLLRIFRRYDTDFTTSRSAT